MLEITSRTNEKIKYAVHLGESASFRREQNEFFLEGARLCRDAAESGIPVRQAFFTRAALNRYAPYTDVICRKAGECYLISDDIAGKLAATEGAQGVFCVCQGLKAPGSAEQLNPKGRYLALENVQDPSNLGAVCRTAEALGITGLIISGGCDVYNPKALRAAMGSSLRMELLLVSDLPGLLTEANAKGMLTLASTPREEAENICRIPLPQGVICAVGNEGSGITDTTFAACQKAVTIPMAGRAESLNASAAAAILIWELSGKGQS